MKLNIYFLLELLWKIKIKSQYYVLLFCIWTVYTNLEFFFNIAWTNFFKLEIPIFEMERLKFYRICIKVMRSIFFWCNLHELSKIDGWGASQLQHATSISHLQVSIWFILQLALVDFCPQAMFKFKNAIFYATALLLQVSLCLMKCSWVKAYQNLLFWIGSSPSKTVEKF